MHAEDTERFNRMRESRRQRSSETNNNNNENRNRRERRNTSTPEERAIMHEYFRQLRSYLEKNRED